MAHFLVERMKADLAELKANPGSSGLAKDFGQSVKSLRKKLGLTQTQFAEIYKIRIANLRNWEQSKRVLRSDSSARTLIAMINADPKGMAEIAQKIKPKSPA